MTVLDQFFSTSWEMLSRSSAVLVTVRLLLAPVRTLGQRLLADVGLRRHRHAEGLLRGAVESSRFYAARGALLMRLRSQVGRGRRRVIIRALCRTSFCLFDVFDVSEVLVPA